MSLLVFNSGSSSIKYKLFGLDPIRVLCAGMADRIGEPQGQLTHRWQESDGSNRELTKPLSAPDHTTALTAIQRTLRDTSFRKESAALTGIGHRVVHGGETFCEPALITPEVIAAVRAMFALAPLHNPPNLAAIEACRQLFPDTPQVAVFDTAFHQSMPPPAFRYALPEICYATHNIRRYGFHGTSHQYVAQATADHLAVPLQSLNLITLHLGNGASAAAIQHGRCVDTSMGLTPLEGLMMGTRCGDLDPAVVFHLLRVTGRKPAEVEQLLNTQSGLKGVCGANDMREVLQRVAAGDPRAQLALEMFCYRVKKYLGAYFAILGRLDALVFTGGIGEEAAPVRERICSGLPHLGLHLDPTRNQSGFECLKEIQAPAASVKILAVRTDEELAIAQQTLATLK